MTTNGGHTPPSPDDLEVTLRTVEAVQRHTRAAVHPAWFPLVVFGVLALASAPFCAIGGGLGVGVFWLVAGPAGGVATSLYYRRREQVLGAGVRGGPYWAVAAGIFVAAWLTGASGSERVETAGPMLAVALGYLAFARLEKNPQIAVVAAVLAVVAVVVGITGIAHGCVVLSLTFGLAFTSTGLVLRRSAGG
jgi:hypothetical protein